MVIKDAHQLMKDNLIVKHYAGSHAYGTNLPTSDTDFRGIFCADPINIRTPFFTVKECEDVNEEDTKLYELAHFMKLAVDCNPNIVETLWVDQSDIVYAHEAFSVLQKHKHELLNKRILMTTLGYGSAQLKKIKGHNKWINNPQPVEPPKQIDYVSMVHNFTDKKVFKIDLREYYKDYRLIPYDGEIYGLYPMKGYTTFSEKYTLNTNYENDPQTHLEDVKWYNALLSPKRRQPHFIVKFNKEHYNEAKTKHSQYWEWKNNRNVVRSELEENYGYDCYSDDTEFLTSSGWKNFDDVSDDDLLATFNRFTHKIEYQRPYERIDSKFTGNMYHLRGYHVDCNVTSNHHMFVRPFSRNIRKEGVWDFERAAELSETFDTLNVISPKINRQLLPPGFNQEILTHMEIIDYLKVMGWYISDGTINFYKNGKVKHLMISQSKPQSRLTKSLNRKRNSKKITCSEYIYQPRGLSKYPERRWIFKSDISTLLYQDCGHGSYYKRIPNWCFYLTKREMTSLLVALLQGDGSQKNHQTHTFVYYTANNLLADDVQRLAFLCGFETSKYGPYKNATQLNAQLQMFHIHINMKPPKTRRHTRICSVTSTKVENQRVVCFMVKNFTLVTRRHGQVGLHGNTKHASHLIRLLKMSIEAAERGEIIVKRPDAEELKAIRNGSLTYEQLIEYSDSLEARVDILSKTCTLPSKPNYKLAAKLVMEVQDIIWSTN